MTDYEKLKKCFDEIGIEYEFYEEKREKFIKIESVIDETIIQIIFDINGKYVEMQ